MDQSVMTRLHILLSIVRLSTMHRPTACNRPKVLICYLTHEV